MKDGLKYILLSLVLLVGTLTAGAVGMAETGVRGKSRDRERTSLPYEWIP